MAGIYIHIPFCKTRCIYCDFYSTTHSELQDRYIDALCTELRLRKPYLLGTPIHTIYLGGGTPSQLSISQLDRLFHVINDVYGLNSQQEITLEANPDDLNAAYVHDLCHLLPFNRISMGIQTFDDSTLQLLNRRHNARQAVQAVEQCRQVGFHNISIDLIYGLPGENDQRWQRDLQQAIALQVEHLSAYHLTYEEGTPIYNMLHNHRIHEVDEESSIRFFSTLIDTLTAAGYVHYEISNFCQPGQHSRHNSSYWQGIPYLGCGPSAHSFNTQSREWNVSSLMQYLQGMEQGKRPFQIEQLDNTTRYNETIMTRLRTMWGINLAELSRQFGQDMYIYCTKMAAPYLQQGTLSLQNDTLRLTRKGIFISDGIISDLMYINE